MVMNTFPEIAAAMGRGGKLTLYRRNQGSVISDQISGTSLCVSQKRPEGTPMDSHKSER
jgi:hypothetical protein